MSDILSAASLFLAVLGLLYSAWYGEIQAALQLEIPKHAADRGPAKKQLESAFRARALPLACGSVCLALILTPDAVGIVRWSARAYLTHGPGAFSLYDGVGTLFCAIWVMTSSFAAHASSLAFGLWRLGRAAG